MANLITRGFGALQRIITRGFYSGAAPSPDCYIGLGSKITEEVKENGFSGAIKIYTGLTSVITEPVTLQAVGFQGLIDGNNGYQGKITDESAFKGNICDLCEC